MVQKKVSPLKKRKKCPKKRKKNNIIINNKTYYFYKIIWEDIVGDSTIVSFDDFCKMKTAMITSFAYILKRDNKYTYIFASVSDDGYFGDRNIIPNGCIKSMQKH
tara:strand:+ start:47 stop:361 length:315 start_codon:yes stop_codon:yes gene_type:complete